MPSMRERMSMKSLLDLRGGKDQDHPKGSYEPQGNDQLRPQSVAEGRYSYGHGDSARTESLRPSTAYGRRPTSARSRFSLTRNRHASEPELFARYVADASDAEDLAANSCPAPVIGFTPSLWDAQDEPPKRKFEGFSSKQKARRSISYNAHTDRPTTKEHGVGRRLSFAGARPSFGKGAFGSSMTVGSYSLAPSPAANDTDSPTSSRPSDDRYVSSVASDTKSPTSKLFTLPRRKKKQPGSLFPLPVHLSPSNQRGPEAATQGATIFPVQPSHAHFSQSIAHTPMNETPLDAASKPETRIATPLLTRSTSYSAVSNTLVGAVSPPPPLLRHSSSNSAPTENPLLAPSALADRTSRGRSGTETSMSSLREDERASTPFHESVARTSMTSTTLGRNSIAHLRSLTSRFRHPSDSQSPRHGSPGGLMSKNESFAMSKETLPVPDREDGESAAQYYARLERDMPKKGIALLLSKSADPFSHDVLRSLLRTFKFYEEPLDISLRKFLWEIDLPGEAQQIDRVISAFAERYFECNPPIFNNFDETYLAAYSLIILHSDLFNKSNRRKMQRSEYQKNTGGHGIDEEILGYFYDNIQYTEFVKQQQDDDESFGKSKKGKPRRKVRKIKVSNNENGEKGNIDPYDFILNEEQKLEVLRPALRGALQLDDTFNFTGTTDTFDVRAIRGAFARSCILQTISTRSRPEAFSSPLTMHNPNEAHPGVVEIKVAKVGILWRKDPKKKTARSPWQEWGAMLTQSQLHFFRNKDWIKDLMRQVDSHRKMSKHPDTSQKQGRFQGVIFRPQIQDFKPEHSVRTSSALALRDITYDKHKNGFLLISYADLGSDETVLAESDSEMNDWLLKINFAAAFAGAKVDMQAPATPAKTPLIRLVSSPELGSSDDAANVQAGSSDDLDLASFAAHTGPNDLNVARDQAVRSRLQILDVEIDHAQHKLDENLKTARHLQILAPFPPRTRSDLLSFGARVAHRVRWTRFDVWRLKVQASMLRADHDAGDASHDHMPSPLASAIVRSASPKLLPSALIRLNSRASGILSPQKSSRSGLSGQRHANQSRLATSPGSDLAGGMDQAFATPVDTLSRSESSSDNPWRLPPLTLGPESTPTDGERSESAGTESVARPSSLVDGPYLAPSAHVPSMSPSLATNPEDQMPTSENRPSTALESEKDRNDGFGPPPSRIGNRRSLQRQTLRESRDIPAQTRVRRGKESISSAGNDDASSMQELETLPRAPGSFTLHGKKASVITLGSEFQSMTPEERLKARKQALALDTKDFFEIEEDESGIIRQIEIDDQTGSSTIPSEDLHTASPHFGSGWPERPYDTSSDQEEMKRRSSSTAIGGAESDEEGSRDGALSSKPTSRPSTTYFDAASFQGLGEEPTEARSSNPV